MKRCFVMLLLAFCTNSIFPQNEKPDWLSRSDNVWVEDGIIYARGSEAIHDFFERIEESGTNTITIVGDEYIKVAIENLIRAIANNEITGYLPVAAEEGQTRSIFSINDISIEIGPVRILHFLFAFEEGIPYANVLISCLGAGILD